MVGSGAAAAELRSAGGASNQGGPHRDGRNPERGQLDALDPGGLLQRWSVELQTEFAKPRLRTAVSRTRSTTESRAAAIS